MIEVLLLSLAFGVSVVAAIPPWLQRRRHAALLRQIEAADELPPGDTGHLGAFLAALVEHTRILRASVVTPLYRWPLPEYISGWTRRRVQDRLHEEEEDAFDLAIVNVRRELWDWMKAVDTLDADDRQLLERLGASAEPVRTIVARPGSFRRTDDPGPTDTPDLARLGNDLLCIVLELRRFEQALLSSPAHPYR